MWVASACPVFTRARAALTQDLPQQRQHRPMQNVAPEMPTMHHPMQQPPEQRPAMHTAMPPVGMPPGFVSAPFPAPPAVYHDGAFPTFAMVDPSTGGAPRVPFQQQLLPHGALPHGAMPYQSMVSPQHLAPGGQPVCGQPMWNYK